ncbi:MULTISPECIES: hypothetical protein [Oceanobacillus]|uniref:Uncharacterized protein n=1 Tax=Oceanobacillus kimchii TaxID=746691 RepID=A0ABQ5TJ56_9BACI|nr:MULTISPECIES: hypothetical protein [Oceanobacillus]MBT2600760.1 hypothetical protein [Oceanobacillus sp. ISL-74]MBT2650843.1 hypothetical protein [Oceanobacillus sp. ISL-73]MCT1575515.1 efflux RND transporter permease subunit [Oceanobacillus kimchii]MCT2137146.1 efflux RND transporter permease subunit [Oceanobacillus kimchii]OEH55332.1 hypothetical protein AQ616_03925 [Oceanobacillus sp. E9]
MTENKWAIIIGSIVLLAFFLPFTLLTNIEKWYGSFFIWIVLTLIVIFCNITFTKNWGKYK